MAGMAAKMLMRGGGKLGRLASKVPGLPARLPGMAAAGGAGAAMGAVAGVPGIPGSPGMGPPAGTPVTERVYVGPRHKRIFFPGTRASEPEPPEPPPTEPRQWTPASVTGSFAGMAATTAVATGGVVAAAKAPGLFAIWAPKILIILLVMGLIGVLIYYTFIRKKKDKE